MVACHVTLLSRINKFNIRDSFFVTYKTRFDLKDRI